MLPVVFFYFHTINNAFSRIKKTIAFSLGTNDIALKSPEGIFNRYCDFYDSK